jgi:hypothetical protein
MEVIGVDIGYGMTKAVRSDGRALMFRSVVGVGAPDMLGLEAGPAKVVSLHGGRYTVGEEAERFKLPLVSVRKRGFVDSPA